MVEEKQIEGAPLSFVAELFPADGGGLLSRNWQGHNREQAEGTPKLIEVDKNGKMIWSLTGYQETGMISAIYPLIDIFSIFERFYVNKLSIP